MKSFFRSNGLSIVLIALFLLSWVGQIFTGHASFNEELVQHKMPIVSLSEYLLSGHFIESTFENWESEFLQMAVFVWLTAFLYQRGSAESNPLPDEEKNEEQFPMRYFTSKPWARKFYENSLSLSLAALFLISFVGHWYGGWKEENLKRLMTHDPEGPISLGHFFVSSDFWFQSFQNWQSEFLSVAAIVLLTIVLRQKNSAQSKEVDCPHSKTES